MTIDILTNRTLSTFFDGGHSHHFGVISHCGFDLHFFSCDVTYFAESEIKGKVITRNCHLQNQNQELETSVHTAGKQYTQAHLI